MLLLFVPLLITCNVVKQSIAVTVKNCNNFEGEGIISRFEVPTCPNDGICELQRNSQPEFTVEFTTSNQYDSFLMKINSTSAIFPGAPKTTFPYLGFNTTGCPFLVNDQCPLKGNKKYTYSNKIIIRSYYPEDIVYEITYALMGKNRGHSGLKPIGCSLIEVTVV